MIVDGKVVSARTIRSTVSRDVMITGQFNQQEVNALVKVLQRKPDDGKTDTHRDVLKAELQQAKAVAARQEAAFKAGIITGLEFQAAKGKVEVLEAELTGDSVQVAKAKLAVARRLLELASSSFKAGVLTASDYEKFTGDVTIAEAQLHEAEAKAKSSKLTDAKAPLAITAQDGKVVVTTPDSRLVADRIELGQTGAKANGNVAIAEAQARETAGQTLAVQPPVVVETFPVSGRGVAPGRRKFACGSASP